MYEFKKEFQSNSKFGMRVVTSAVGNQLNERSKLVTDFIHPFEFRSVLR